MKRLLLTLFTLLGVLPALADPPDEDVLRPRKTSAGSWYVQFDGGLNFNFMNGNPRFRSPLTGETPNPVFESASSISPFFGATLGHRFSPAFSLAFAVQYDARKVDNSGAGLDTCTIFDGSGFPVSSTLMATQKSYSAQVDYVSLSLLPAYHVDQLFIYAGPTVSIPVSHLVSETETIEDASACVFFYQGIDSSRTITGKSDTLNTATRFSFKIGLGYVFPVAPNISIVPQVDFDFGLTRTFENDGVLALRNPDPALARSSFDVFVNKEIKINSLQASVGVRIDF